MVALVHNYADLSICDQILETVQITGFRKSSVFMHVINDISIYA